MYHLYCIGNADSDVRRIAGHLRSGLKGCLDVEQLAAKMHVSISTEDLPPSLWGLAPSSDWVVVNRRLDSLTRRFAVVHELGHVTVERRTVRLSGIGEELFCDRLADELLLPTDELAETKMLLPALITTYRAPSFTVAAQLIRAGLAPPMVRVDDARVVCSDCGHRQRATSCECGPFRQDPRLSLPRLEDCYSGLVG